MKDGCSCSIGETRDTPPVADAAGLTDSYRVFTEGDDLYDAMISDIGAARRSVLLETYIFKEDRVGRRFLDALRRTAECGVHVHLRFDAFGSKGLITRTALEVLQNSGVDFRWSKRWSWRHPLDYERRNHRKFLVIDERVAYLGGFNIGDESSLIYRGERRWRDTHIRLSGRIAKRAAVLFWDFRGKRKCRREEWSNGMLLLPNYGLGCRYRWRCMLNGRFGAAKRRIWVTTPYFVPDSRTQEQLLEAACRGVDVRLLVPEKSDVPITRWAARTTYGNLLRAGVQIYEYCDRMLHSKTALIDNDWSMIGTSNLDYRSFFTNFELNFLSRSPQLNSTLADIFQNDVEHSTRIVYASWSRRPLFQHLAELVGWMARRWL